MKTNKITNGIIESKLLNTFYNNIITDKSTNTSDSNKHKDKIFLNILPYLSIEDIYNLKSTCKSISYSLSEKTLNKLLKHHNMIGKRREALWYKLLKIKE
jgi:hypothetical protein